jgi:para-nitrobenzyl esterase
VVAAALLVLGASDSRAASTIQQGTLIHLADGDVQGAGNGQARQFLGIPFAAPPVGALRWRPPAPAVPWQGVLPATTFGHSCPQLASLQGPASNVEDCLFLNVFTPAVDDARRPVMVWIHGGAFVIGAGSQSLYDGAPLARRGNVVIVTINYRLGLFGYLRHGPGTGNEGLLDQIAALEWVRTEIAAFGGDPDNVTIFGESAGAMSVATLLGTPRARGLFHRAIAQSGAANVTLSRERAEAIAGQVVSALGLPAGDGAALATLPAARLLEVQRDVFDRAFRGRDGLAFAPVVDGDVVPTELLPAVANGASHDVPLLIGTTLEEMKLFSIMDPVARSMDDATLLARLADRVPGRGDEAVRVYRAARVARGADTSPAELWCAIESDRFFRAPAMRLALAQRAHAPAFAYLFDWRSPLLNGAFGSCHALELPFVFGTFDRGPIAMFAGSGAEAETLAERMQDAWLAFAHRGDPSTPALGPWPVYDEETRSTMRFGRECQLERAPLEAERRFWDVG